MSSIPSTTKGKKGVCVWAGAQGSTCVIHVKPENTISVVFGCISWLREKKHSKLTYLTKNLYLEYIKNSQTQEKNFLKIFEDTL